MLVAMSFDGDRAGPRPPPPLPDGAGTFDRLLPQAAAAAGGPALFQRADGGQSRHRGASGRSVAFLLDEGVRYLIMSLNYAAAWSEETLRRAGAAVRATGPTVRRLGRQGRKFYLSPLEVKLASHILGEPSSLPALRIGCAAALGRSRRASCIPCVQFTRAGPASRWCIGHVSTGIDEAARERLHAESEAEKAPCRDVRDPGPLPTHLRLPELADHRQHQRRLARALPQRADAGDGRRRRGRCVCLPKRTPAFCRSTMTPRIQFSLWLRIS